LQKRIQIKKIGKKKSDPIPSQKTLMGIAEKNPNKKKRNKKSDPIPSQKTLMGTAEKNPIPSNSQKKICSNSLTKKHMHDVLF